MTSNFKSKLQMQMDEMRKKYEQDIKDNKNSLEPNFLLQRFEKEFRRLLEDEGIFKPGSIDDYKEWHKVQKSMHRTLYYITKLDWMQWYIFVPIKYKHTIISFCKEYGVFVMDDCGKEESMLHHPVVTVYYDHGCQFSTNGRNGSETLLEGNFDGFRKEDGRAGGAALIRRGAELIGFKMMHLYDTKAAEEAELAGLYCLVTLAEEKNLSNLQIVGDCKAVIDVFCGSQPFDSLKPVETFLPRISAIFPKLMRINDFTWRWQYCQSNMAANFLARKAANVFKKPPYPYMSRQLSWYLWRDNKGAPYFRINQNYEKCPLLEKLKKEKDPNLQAVDVDAGVDENQLVCQGNGANKYMQSRVSYDSFLHKSLRALQAFQLMGARPPHIHHHSLRAALSAIAIKSGILYP